MKGFVPPPVFIYHYFGNPEGYGFAAGQGQGEALAVDVHHFVQGKPSRNLLDIPLGENDEVFIHKHIRIITKGFRKMQAVNEPIRLYRYKRNFFLLFITFSVFSD